MYEDLVKLARHCAEVDACINCPVGGCQGVTGIMNRLANAIEELQYDLDIAVRAKAAATEACKPRWVSVTEALPESVDDDVLVTDGEGCAVGYWRPDAQAWDSTDFGWLENRSEPPCGIHTVTHWMPLPPLPKPPKEDKYVRETN